MNLKIINPFQRKYIAAFGFIMFCMSFMYRSIIVSVFPQKIVYIIYALVILCMTVAVSEYDTIRVKGRLIIEYAPWLFFVFIFVLLHSQFFAHKDYGTTIVWLFYFSMLLYIPLCPKSWYKMFIYIMLALILINVAAVYFFVIFKSKYQIMYRLFHEWPTGTDKGHAGYRAGLTSHYSHNAMLIVVGLFVYCAKFIINGDALKKAKKNKMIFVMLIFAFALILANKRAHVLFGFVAVIFGYILYNPHKVKKNIITAGIAAVVLVTLFIFMARFVPFINELLERFSTAGEDSETLSRFEFWKLAFSNFLKSPVYGIGWGGYQFEYHEHLYVYNPYGVDYPYLQAHNVYIQLLCECGLAGTSLLLFCIGRVFKKTVGILKNRNVKYSDNYPLIVYSLIFQVFFMMYCLTGNCLYDMMFAFYAIAAGISIGLYT